MKWKVGLVLLLLCAAGIYFAVRTAPKVVFRGLKWGDMPDKLGPFAEIVETTQDCAIYIRHDDSLMIENVALETYPAYGFVGNALIFIILHGDYDSLERIGYTQYGDPMTVEGGPIWKTDNLVCLLTQKGNTGVMVIANRAYMEKSAREWAKTLGIAY